MDKWTGIIRKLFREYLGERVWDDGVRSELTLGDDGLATDKHTVQRS